MKIALLTWIIFLTSCYKCTFGQEVEEGFVIEKDSLKCESYEFKCHNGQKCIDVDQECDMVPDCDDNSDEHYNCKNFECNSGGQVIAERFHCDGYVDCDDESDEIGETANCTLFTCMQGRTITDKQVCNEVDDCNDKFNSDECNCSHSFTCANGVCIEKSMMCDGINDCGDKSDEENIPAPTFTCFNKQVIDASLKCNGEADCDDTSDECGCMTTFTCDNLRCINTLRINDGQDDCGDGSDETQRTTTKTITTTTTYEQSTEEHEYQNDGSSSEIEESGIDSGDVATEIDIIDPIVTSPIPKDNVTLIEITTGETSKFTCANGKTIETQFLCDGKDNCDDGYRSDECDCDDTFKCPSSTSQQLCIVSDLKCDGENDCRDNLRSDECDCPDTFTCHTTKECISTYLLCDGTRNCEDGSDEYEDVCSIVSSLKCENGFLCKNERCINKTKKCDGVDDCGDCSDEDDCIRMDKLHHCKNGGCVTRERRCDGIEDCPNGDDEDKCYTEKNKETTSTTLTKILTKSTTPSKVEVHMAASPHGNSGKRLRPQAVPLAALFLQMAYLLQ